ncbi:hypothetical protein HF086_009641 [Spodoptera exigua]|uniref:Uncharacterized protein n=1 Tax=Spodoptera exigua TaxID=7107 RepID=A0A922MTV8_SPOEX|nr:hypothetical protein HF086_009641 [Spodoptera exigua]
MADELDLDVAPGDLSEECRLFFRERYRGRSLPPNLSGILNQTQSGDAQTSQASGSGVKANAQGQQAGAAKEKKPAPEQKATRTPRKRKPEDEELVAKRNKCYELRSEYNKYRVEFRHFQDHRTANRQKEQIKHTYGQLQTQIKNYKLFVEKKKLDIDEDILNLDKLITGTKENNYQKTVEEEECENTEKEPQISIAKNNEDTYNIIIKIPK